LIIISYNKQWFIFVYLENKIDLSLETDEYRDLRFTKWLSKNVKLQSIPFSIFFSEKSKLLAQDYMRLCFFKVMFLNSYFL